MQHTLNELKKCINTQTMTQISRDLPMRFIFIFLKNTHFSVSVHAHEGVFCVRTGSNLSRQGQAVLMSLCTSAAHPAETMIQRRCVVLYPPSLIHQGLLSGRLEMYGKVSCVCVW